MSFNFKQFSIEDQNSAMKVGTDAVLLGSWVDVENAKSILDIGTGSGVIALMLAQRSKANITGIDIQKQSIDNAQCNFENSPWPERLTSIHSSIQDYTKTCASKFDMIVSNPPFFTNSLLSSSESKSLAKHNNELPYRELVQNAYQLLEDNGRFAVIIPSTELINFNLEATRAGFYTIKKLKIFPVEGKPLNRLIMSLSKQAKPIQQLSELTIRNKHKHFTEEYKKLTKDYYLDF